MTKRFKVHNMLKGFKIGEITDLEVMQELIEEYGSSAKIELHITDNGRNMTYEEVENLLNELNEENEQLKQQLADDFNQSNCITVQKSKIKELEKENEQLKQTSQDYEDIVNNWFIDNWNKLSDEMKQSAHLELGIDIEYDGDFE